MPVSTTKIMRMHHIIIPIIMYIHSTPILLLIIVCREIWRRVVRGEYSDFEAEYLDRHGAAIAALYPSQHLPLTPRDWLDLHTDRVLIHGMCHLHGHTHDREEDWAAMLAEEARLQDQLYSFLCSLQDTDPSLCQRLRHTVRSSTL